MKKVRGVWCNSAWATLETPPTRNLPPHLRRIFEAQIADCVLVLARFRDRGISPEEPRLLEQLALDYRWVMSASDKWLFSFERVCMTLGLEPSAVRQRLRVRGLLSDALGEAVRAHEAGKPVPPRIPGPRRIGPTKGYASTGRLAAAVSPAAAPDTAVPSSPSARQAAGSSGTDRSVGRAGRSRVGAGLTGDAAGDSSISAA